MDVTPELLRRTEFREHRKGYDPAEVRDFLGRLADAVGRMQDELGAALARAERAERRLLDAPPEGEELSRTLVLAQRTADAVLDEARTRAAELVADAEAQATARTSEAEERATRVSAEADERAAATTAAADERAATTTAAADERAASVVADAEARVATDLVPLLEQREAIVRDVDALRGWARDVRARIADELRQQLAWLDGDGPELPQPPQVVAVEVPEATVPVPGAAPAEEPGEAGASTEALVLDPDAAADADADAAAPGADADAAVDVADEEPSEPTAVLDLRELEGDDRPADDGPLAVAAADDPFLAELRRAVTDDEPLGPRERVVVDPGGDDVHHDDDELLGPSSVFRRKKRR